MTTAMYSSRRSRTILCLTEEHRLHVEVPPPLDSTVLSFFSFLHISSLLVMSLATHTDESDDILSVAVASAVLGADLEDVSQAGPPNGSTDENSTNVSTIYPDDSASQRNAQLRQGRLRGGAPSEVSATRSAGVLSFHSSADSHLYKVFGGRAFNSQSDYYALPADDDEHSRLDMQHFAVCLSMDSLFPFKNLVRYTLRKEQDQPPEVMDMGTGSGRWAVDMAIAFPHAQIVGLDLVPPALLPKSEIPANCRFEIDDANLSMVHYENTFNLVHARSIDAGINDMQSFIYEIARALRPGGVLILGAGSPQIFDQNLNPLRVVEPGHPGFSWVQYTFGHIYTAYLNRGSYGVNSPLYWKSWAETNPNYSAVHFEEYFIPLGPWKDNMTERETFIANLMREDIARVFPAFKRLLMNDGQKDEDVDLWIEESARELREMSCRTYFRWPFIAAVRSEAPWQERLEVPREAEPFISREMIAGLDPLPAGRL